MEDLILDATLTDPKEKGCRSIVRVKTSVWHDKFGLHYKKDLVKMKRLSWDFQILEEDSSNIGADEVATRIIDFFGDDYFDAIKIAGWIKNQLDTNPKFITCIGNHDAAYRWPYSTCANCSGFTKDKSTGINLTLFKQDWDKFLPYYYHKEGNWMLSHAGFDPFIFKEDLRNDFSKLDEAFITAISDIEGERRYHPYFGVGYARGGSQPHGGITWEDFNSINPVPQWNQIVGHTILSEPTIKFRHKDNKYLKTKLFSDNLMSPHNANRMDNGDIIVGIDTHNKHYALITDGVLTIHETDPKYLEFR